MSRSNNQTRSIVIATVAPFVTIGIASLASAQVVFQQLPLGDLQTNPALPYPGLDELSTATLTPGNGTYTGLFAADDFAVTVTGSIADVEWWGGYPNGLSSGSQPIQNFLISFESNVPASTSTPFSEPGQSLSAQVVSLTSASTPGSGMFTASAVPSVPGPDGALYQYNAELANPFPEQADTVYWLKIVALAGSQNPEWGWHDRDYTILDPYAAPPGDSILGVNDNNQTVYGYMDDAVSGYVNYQPSLPPSQGLTETNMSPLYYSGDPTIDGFNAADGIAPPSEDLAFELYNVPEPASTGLMVVSGILVLARRRRKRA